MINETQNQIQNSKNAAIQMQIDIKLANLQISNFIGNEKVRTLLYDQTLFLILYQSMDNEDRYFYDEQMDIFSDRPEQIPPHSDFQPLPLVSNFSLEPQSNKDSSIPKFRALNPMQKLKDLPQSKQNEYFFMFNNHKHFNGIQHFFQSCQTQKASTEFLGDISADALDNMGENFQLERLFRGQSKLDHREALQNTLMTLNRKIDQINQKVISSINLHKTISLAFYEHLDNYASTIDSSSFFRDFQQNLRNLVTNNRKLRGPGIELIASLYQFWQKSFKDFVNEIWKYSSRFTLNFFKKQERQGHVEACSEEPRSESSNTMGSKDKRKGWTTEELQFLQQLVDSNVIFSQSVLKKLATQFGRSVSSVSSKLQKLSKPMKDQVDPQQSLLRKAIQILKLHPQGLNRESIVQKMNEHYQMGYGGHWQKSVGQLLSSRKEFIRLKSKHKLLNPQAFAFIPVQNDKSKISFKEKVVQIFLSCPNAEADLRTLVQQYILLFQQGSIETFEEQRKKSIEANISKTLSRYDIFQREAKTLYLLNPLFKPQGRNMEVQIDSYFQL